MRNGDLIFIVIEMSFSDFLLSINYVQLQITRDNSIELEMSLANFGIA